LKSNYEHFPWRELCSLVDPHYSIAGNFLQQWFTLSDPAVEEALYDSPLMRHFAQIDLGSEPVPDETTVCKFRHLLEEHNLGHIRPGRVPSSTTRSTTPECKGSRLCQIFMTVERSRRSQYVPLQSYVKQPSGTTSR
jgi:hypothetical protein